MRPFLLTAGLAALSIALAAPALAEDADCGLLCRISGYLGSDHMADAGDGAAGSAAAAKPHRAHAAARKAPAAGTPVKTHTATLAATPPHPSVPTSAKPGTVTEASVKPRPPMTASAKPSPVTEPSTKPPAAVPAAPKTAASVRPTPKRAHAVVPPPPAEVKSDDVASREAPRPKAIVTSASAARPHRIAAGAPGVAVSRPGTLTAAATIPGSAPAMPAGFQPFMSR